MINKVMDSFREAVADVFDGAVILFGGFGPANGSASYLIRALVEQGAKNLTVVANTPGSGRAAAGPPGSGPPGGGPPGSRPPGGGPPGGGPPAQGAPRMMRRSPPNFDNPGLLIQNGQVIKAICAFPGTPMPGVPSAFFDRMRAGLLEVEVTSQGTLAERIRAAKAGIPAFYTPTGPGTRLEKGKEVREINGRKCLLEYAIKADFAFVRAYKGDRHGNLVYQGTSRNFNGAMAGAAKVTIAEIDELVELGGLDPEVIATPGLYVNRVVPRPADWRKG